MGIFSKEKSESSSKEKIAVLPEKDYCDEYESEEKMFINIEENEKLQKLIDYFASEPSNFLNDWRTKNRMISILKESFDYFEELNEYPVENFLSKFDTLVNTFRYKDSCIEKQLYLFFNVIIKGTTYAYYTFEYAYRKCYTLNEVYTYLKKNLLIAIADYIISLRNDVKQLDDNEFNNIFSSIKDIKPTYFEPQEFVWSFADFIPAIDYMIDKGIPAEKASKLICSVYNKHFDEFFMIAESNDIEALIKFDDKYSDYYKFYFMDYIYNIVGIKANSYKLYHNSNFFSVDKMNTLCREYPFMTPEILKFSFLHNMYNITNSDDLMNYLGIPSTIKIAQVAADYQKYHSDTVSFDQFEFRKIIETAVTKFDGINFDILMDILTEYFDLKNRYLECTLKSIFYKFFFNADGEYSSIHPQVLTRVAKLLSSKRIYNLVEKLRPELLLGL